MSTPSDALAAATFSADWLSLRERYDHVARAGTRLLPLVAPAGDRPRRIVDLGAGLGSNLRFLAPRLAGDQVWCLVDHDRALLDAAIGRIAGWAAAGGLVAQPARSPEMLAFDRPDGSRLAVAATAADLAATPPGRLFEDADLVTASALLDLVGGTWLNALAAACRRRRAAVLCALTYTGTIDWQPVDDDDRLVAALINRHQKTDKGFGRALGPAAAGFAADLFGRYGFDTILRDTPWRLEPTDRDLQGALIEDWRGAAAAVRPDLTPTLDGWAARRGAHLAAGTSRLVVAHRDLLAVPG